MPPSYRRFPVYREAKAFARAVDDFVEGLPSARRYLKDQLRRAALSILLNLAEGAGETRPKEKARIYRLAKRSALECGAALDYAADIVPSKKAEAVRLDRRASGLAQQLHHLVLDQLKRAARKDSDD